MRQMDEAEIRATMLVAFRQAKVRPEMIYALREDRADGDGGQPPPAHTGGAQGMERGSYLSVWRASFPTR